MFASEGHMSGIFHVNADFLLVFVNQGSVTSMIELFLFISPFFITWKQFAVFGKE